MASNNAPFTSLELLPVEIIHQIFAFFSLQEIITAFSGLNSRIESIIRSARRINHVVKYQDADSVELLYLFPIQIGRLIIIQCEPFLSRSFDNLRSLILTKVIPALLDSIRPQHFSMLEILHIFTGSSRTHKAMNEYTETASRLFEIIFSNGFSRLRVCIAVGVGVLAFCNTWTGAPGLRYFHLDMKTSHDYEQLRSICPQLRRIKNFENSRIVQQYGVYNCPAHKLIISNIRMLKQWESEKKFILHVNPLELFRAESPPPRFNNTTVAARFKAKDNINILGRIFPTKEPYCRASFLIGIILSINFPFKMPELIVLDPVYHPNVDKLGKLCFCCDGWRPTTSLMEVIEAAIRTIDNPNLDHVLNYECALEYRTNYSQFYEKALKHVLAFGRPRCY